MTVGLRFGPGQKRRLDPIVGGMWMNVYVHLQMNVLNRKLLQECKGPHPFRRLTWIGAKRKKPSEVQSLGKEVSLDRVSWVWERAKMSKEEPGLVQRSRG